MPTTAKNIDEMGRQKMPISSQQFKENDRKREMSRNTTAPTWESVQNGRGVEKSQCRELLLEEASACANTRTC